MKRKILTACAGIVAAAGVIALLVKKNMCEKGMKPENQGEAENPSGSDIDHSLNCDNSACQDQKISAAAVESTEETFEPTEEAPNLEQTDPPAAQDVPDETKQNVKPARRVGQYDDEMNLLAEYESAKAAAKAVGCNRSSIRDAAKGKQKHAAGYVWKYLD